MAVQGQLAVTLTACCQLRPSVAGNAIGTGPGVIQVDSFAPQFAGNMGGGGGGGMGRNRGNQQNQGYDLPCSS